MRRCFYFLILAISVVCFSCTGHKVYDSYDHTPLQGWDRVDELSYYVPALKDSGRYVTNLGLRITETYPFQALTLIVQQKVYNKERGKACLQTYTDTLNCTLFDDKGAIKGNGISYFQYHYRVSEIEFHKGDSLHITVRHGMRREIMPGISDIGISLTKQ